MEFNVSLLDSFYIKKFKLADSKQNLFYLQFSWYLTNICMPVYGTDSDWHKDWHFSINKSNINAIYQIQEGKELFNASGLKKPTDKTL